MYTVKLKISNTVAFACVVALLIIPFISYAFAQADTSEEDENAAIVLVLWALAFITLGRLLLALAKFLLERSKEKEKDD